MEQEAAKAGRTGNATGGVGMSYGEVSILHSGLHRRHRGTHRGTRPVNKHRLVLIEWEDAYGCSTEWTELSEPNASVLVCRSVGWLIYDGDDCKLVVPHLSGEHPRANAQGCGDMTIPATAVRRMVDLDEPTGGDTGAPQPGVLND